MLIKKYCSDLENTWNAFIKSSKQGTFLLDRNYMDYHSDRFKDHSLLFYDDKGSLIAVLPANIRGNTLYSHEGLSYGGLIYDVKAKTVDVLQCFESLKSYAKNNEIERLVYKKTPSVYQTYYADEDLYALFRNNSKLTRRDISYIINIQNQLKWNELRKRCLKKAIKEELSTQFTDDYKGYHSLLSETLVSSHNAKPVHCVSEMILLASRFPDNIKLVCAHKGNKMLGGVWLFIEKNTIHTQYIAVNSEGKESGAFEIIVDFLLKEFSSKEHLSFGISTEQGGMYLNEGLARQKESFGARGICCDFYEIDFTKVQ